MKLVDRKMIAATRLGVYISEVYSPERVAKVAKRYGLVAVSSVDPTTGFDFFTRPARAPHLLSFS